MINKGKSVTITATSKDDGTYHEITLAAGASDKDKDKNKATMAISSWESGKDPQKDPASEEELYELYDVTANAIGSKVVCKADVFGHDPTITFTFGTLSTPGLTVTVEGAMAKNGTKNYLIVANDQLKLELFITNCHFPTL